jgi:hypothetical protein
MRQTRCNQLPYYLLFRPYRLCAYTTYDEMIIRFMKSQTDRQTVSEDTLLAIEEGIADIRNKKTRELNEFCDSHGI